VKSLKGFELTFKGEMLPQQWAGKTESDIVAVLVHSSKPLDQPLILNRFVNIFPWVVPQIISAFWYWVIVGGRFICSFSLDKREQLR
jgi:hypothetical protein